MKIWLESLNLTDAQYNFLNVVLNSGSFEKNVLQAYKLIKIKIFRASRKTFDTSETQKEIGPLIVQFGKVSLILGIYQMATKVDMTWKIILIYLFPTILGTVQSVIKV